MTHKIVVVSVKSLDVISKGNEIKYTNNISQSRKLFIALLLDTVSKQAPIEAVQKSVQLFEERRYREMRRKNIIGQVCDTPKSYDNVMHVGLRKVTFKWQRGNKIGKFVTHSFIRLKYQDYFLKEI